MSYIEDKNAGMSKITVESGENLNIVGCGREKAIKSTADVFLGFMGIVAFVNQRFIESGTNTRLNVIVI